MAFPFARLENTLIIGLLCIEKENILGSLALSRFNWALIDF